MVSLLVLAGLVVVVVLVVRRAATGAGGTADGHTVRRVFQFLLLFGLFIVVGIGLTGLLGRVLEREVLVAGDETGLARDLAFTVVGGPLLAGLAYWSRRRFVADPGERRAIGWALYVSAASLTSLVTAMAGLFGVLAWVLRLEDYDGGEVAWVVVWGLAWALHWRLDTHVQPREHAHPHHLLGSLLGLGVAATGLGVLLAGSLRVLLGLDADALALAASPLRDGLLTLVIGGPVWVFYWWWTASRIRQGTLWLAYVLLAGVGAGLVTAIVTASVLLHSVLVWLVGDPTYDTAAEHFDAAPTAAAAAAVGTLVWWYHQAVLREAGQEARTEVRRVYEHLMAALGLVAASTGTILVLSALVEAASGAAFVGGRAVNTLLAALTLLAVGGPVWAWHWRLIGVAARAAPAEELTSPTRRLYLLILVGIGGLVAVAALITGVYLVLQDTVEGTLGAETLRRTRFAVGVLVTTALVTAYHWSVFRSDRDQLPAAVAGRGPRFVLLVGPADGEVARHVARLTRGRVQSWARSDAATGTWSVEDVIAALDRTTADEVVVLHEPDGLRVIPVRRS